MSEFHKRLKTLRKENHKKQNDLADLLDVKRATISAYECGKIIPPYDKLDLLAKYFNVSIEYITGKSDSKSKESSTMDVSETLRLLLIQLEDNDSHLTIDGVELDETSKEILINSLENSLKMGKMLAKKKL